LTSDNFEIKAEGGFSFQSDRIETSSVLATGFSNDDVDLKNDSSVDQKIRSAQELERSTQTIPIENNAAFFVSANSRFKDKFFVKATIRQEGSSKLSKNKNWGTFYGLGLGIETAKMLKLKSIKSFKPRIGLSRTGGLPVERGLSNDLVVEFTNSNGVLESRVERAGNESLKWESKNELNIGADLITEKFNVSIDWYGRNTKDIIVSQFVDPAIFGAFIQFGNLMDVHSSGIELNANIKLIEKKKFSYQADFIGSTFKTTVKRFRETFDVGGPFSGPGFGSTLAIRIKEGEALGDIFGPVLKDVDAFGEVIYEDINNDGQVITNIDQGDERIDFTVLGNALPKVELGWNNSLSLGTFELSIFLRSAIGHSKINSSRVFHEVIFDQPSFYNYVRTELYNPDLKFARFNSAFVEKASFVKLDNVRLTKRFTLSEDKFISNFSVSLVGQNLLTWTNYTGTDPEPSIVDNLQFDFNLGEGAALFPGFDRRVQYYPAKTLSLNLQLEF